MNERLVIDNFVLEEFPISSSVLVKINPIFYRPAEVNLLLGDPKKAKDELKWSPKINFEKLVEEMVEKDLNLIKIV